ncbi:NAD(P)H-binding protein [uncultured Christiangramia sp.]|uniref:NAD(P)H-binding protein n=1 Tax=uncultured Christiangramia sp. TaxID=503836 RepID=UPI002608D1FF|nr:NAD(P)H-binding protein [uncultured Christiangramia sp.]
MEQAKTAIILGATGLTGGILLDKLIKDERYRKIKVFGRNHVSQRSEKIEEYLIDLFELEKVQELFTGEEVFCCIGTTKSKTPDKELYRQIDFGIPATAAKLAKRNNIYTFMVISALGADEDSNIFYNKVKGEMEGAVLEQKIPNTYILQPSLIAGDRAENRLMESIFIKLMKFGNHLLIGNLKKYRSIEPEEIANAMQYLANHPYESGRIESDKIKAFSNTSA